jgi:hypothetical protein
VDDWSPDVVRAGNPGAGRAGGCGRNRKCDDGARVERLSPNAFVILYDNATDEWSHGTHSRTTVFPPALAPRMAANTPELDAVH